MMSWLSSPWPQLCLLWFFNWNNRQRFETNYKFKSLLEQNPPPQGYEALMITTKQPILTLLVQALVEGRPVVRLPPGRQVPVVQTGFRVHLVDEPTPVSHQELVQVPERTELNDGEKFIWKYFRELNKTPLRCLNCLKMFFLCWKPTQPPVRGLDSTL